MGVERSARELTTMAELYPLPLSTQLRRIFSQYKAEGTIYDLPQRSFYRPDPARDVSVRFHGHRAATPVGPAAGPHSQLAQNIVLSWLAGGRLIELKTVQLNDQLTIPRPCIHAPNVGFNVEWSQELRIADSLKEYVRGMMLIEILKKENVTHVDDPMRAGETLFDVSVGYDLKGIQSDAITGWLRSIKDASATIEELRNEIPDEFKAYRDINFDPKLSDSITLSTFHGCPAHEIEGICEYLMKELGFHVIVKMNPPMLGKERLEHLLYDKLGYKDLEVNPGAYGATIKFEEATAMCRRLESLAASRGLGFGVKFSNTLEVLNKGEFLPAAEKIKYLSGQPLYVLAMNLMGEWRKVFPTMPVSFSAGIDQHNVSEAVACGLLPVTTCTDLLRPGGYGRLPKYMTSLIAEMQKRDAYTIEDFLIRYAETGKDAVLAWRQSVSGASDIRGFTHERSAEQESLRQIALDAVAVALHSGRGPLRQAIAGPLRSYLRFAETQVPAPESVAGLADVIVRAVAQRAAVLHIPAVIEKLTDNPRYAKPKNQAVPKKIGKKLELYDCINCDKCVPVCPNDANFSIEIEPRDLEVEQYIVEGGALLKKPGERFHVAEGHQLANYADFCNECGNCDVFCPEDGGPYVQKPRFFGSESTYKHDKGHQGFYISRSDTNKKIIGRISGKEYSLSIEGNTARFSNGVIEVELDASSHTPQQAKLVAAANNGDSLDLRYYHSLSLLLEGALSGHNFVSAK
jgi:putative selenate reductase